MNPFPKKAPGKSVEPDVDDVPMKKKKKKGPKPSGMRDVPAMPPAHMRAGC